MRSVGASTRPRTETSCLRGGRSGSPGRRGRSEDQPPRSLSGIFTLRGSEDMTSIKRRPGSRLCLTVLQDRLPPHGGEDLEGSHRGGGLRARAPQRREPARPRGGPTPARGGAQRRLRAGDGLRPPRGGARLAHGRERLRVQVARPRVGLWSLQRGSYPDRSLMSGLAVTPISTTEAVVASLREKILDGAVEPGVALPEADLTREFGVARPTVRAAIQTLCHEGLLKRERNRSAFVPVLGHDDVRDLFSVRIPIECLIVREVLDRAAPLGEVHAAIGRLSLLTPHSHWSEVVDADLGFHHALARAIGSPRLERLYLSMSGEIRLCIAQLRPSWQSPTHMADEHRELLAVIESGDVVAAEARMTAHLERAVRDLTSAGR